MSKTLLRNALIVDGSGQPGRLGDVAIADGRIAEVGQLEDTDAAEVVDLDGLVLSPGFIDVHTHYDAQILWDPDLTPSSWHGVTTVVLGNCGFGIAPTRPDGRTTIVRTLEHVEGMSSDVLEAGIDWDFETFPEYLSTLRSRPKRLNVAAFVGHTPLRLYVLRDEAYERPATESEVATMTAIACEALQAGALGLATSLEASHAGAGGRPVPSRMAGAPELRALASAVAAGGRHILQVSQGPGASIEELGDLSTELGLRITWTSILTGLFGGPGAAQDAVARAAAAGGDVWPQVSCRPMVTQVRLSEPLPFAKLRSFERVLGADGTAKIALYADAAWRDVARPEVESSWPDLWSRMVVQESDDAAAVGRSVGQIALARGTDPFDEMLDIAIEDRLATRFTMTLLNYDDDELGLLLRDPRVLIGLSDAGAHASQLCDACFSSHLLQKWVREEGVLSLEEGVWRLTGQPATVLGLTDRGRVAKGFAADLVAFDPDTIAAGDVERVWDLPGGGDRLISRSRGIEHVWINGVASRRDGKDVAAYAGQLVS